MAKVELYKLNNDGTQSIVLICSLDEGSVVVCEGDQNLIRSLKGRGIFDYSTPEKRVLHFSDGRMFLEQLKFNFKSGYLNASDVLE